MDSNKKFSVSMLTFAGCFVLNELGEKIKVSHLWQNQTTLFIFLRHFGCASCKMHATQIWNEKEKYQSSGAKIIFIGNGEPNFIKSFKNELNIQGADVFTDPSLEAFKAAGFKKSFLAAISPTSVYNQIVPMTKGFRHTPQKGTGNLWQMGGVLVVKSNGQLVYHYVSQGVGDYPAENDSSWSQN